MAAELTYMEAGQLPLDEAALARRLFAGEIIIFRQLPQMIALQRDAWARACAAFGSRQRFGAMCRALLDAGWPVARCPPRREHS